MNPEVSLPAEGILTEVVDPEGSIATPQFAQELLSLHMKEEAKTRIRELLLKKNAGTISSTEQSILQEYLLAGEFIDLLHAKARRTLRQFGMNQS